MKTSSLNKALFFSKTNDYLNIYLPKQAVKSEDHPLRHAAGVLFPETVCRDIEIQGEECAVREPGRQGGGEIRAAETAIRRFATVRTAQKRPRGIRPAAVRAELPVRRRIAAERAYAGKEKREEPRPDTLFIHREIPRMLSFRRHYITRPIVLSTPTGFFSRFGPCKSARDPI